MMMWKDISIFRDIAAPIMEKVIKIRRTTKIFPTSGNIFKAFLVTPYDSVRVVILGQDPYPGYDSDNYPYATGLAFSVHATSSPLPPSLVNIFQELVDDIGCPPPTHGSLMKWATQGVLLLNTSLTVEVGKPGSHTEMWRHFTEEVVSNLHDKVWVLWGKHAQSYIHNIPDKHPKLIMSPHPSPLSAHRGFFKSKPFSRVNSYLDQPIDWSIQ